MIYKVTKELDSKRKRWTKTEANMWHMRGCIPFKKLEDFITGLWPSITGLKVNFLLFCSLERNVSVSIIICETYNLVTQRIVKMILCP